VFDNFHLFASRIHT